MSQFYEKHIFVCENIREGENARVSCGKQGAKKIREYLKEKLKETSASKKIRVNMSGCLDRCELGPVQVSYPDGDWFTLKTEKDVDLFIKSYIVENKIEALSNVKIIE